MLAERLWLISGYPENWYKNLKFSILETFILNVEQHQEPKWSQDQFFVIVCRGNVSFLALSWRTSRKLD